VAIMTEIQKLIKMYEYVATMNGYLVDNEKCKSQGAAAMHGSYDFYIIADNLHRLHDASTDKQVGINLQAIDITPLKVDLSSIAGSPIIISNNQFSKYPYTTGRAEKHE